MVAFVVMSHQDKIIKLYEKGVLLRDIAEQLSIGMGTIYYHLNKKGVDYRGLSRKGNRKYSLNEHYFDVIDSPAKAYWLGFILADGNVSKKGWLLTISLKKEDQDHIRKFLNAIESQHPIKYRTETKSCRVMIGSEVLVECLKKHGIMPAKSLKVKPIKTLYDRDFWRGVFDGDGGIRKKDGKLSFVGTKQMVQGFMRFVGKTTVMRQYGENTFIIEYANLVSRAIGYKIYNRSTVFLQRKRDRWLSFLLKPIKQSHHKEMFRLAQKEILGYEIGSKTFVMVGR